MRLLAQVRHALTLVLLTAERCGRESGTWNSLVPTHTRGAAALFYCEPSFHTEDCSVFTRIAFACLLAFGISAALPAELLAALPASKQDPAAELVDKLNAR